MCLVNQLVDDFFTCIVINYIEGVSVERNVIDQNIICQVVGASDVTCIVVCVCCL